MELYDPPVALTVQNDVGPRPRVKGCPGGMPPCHLPKNLTPQPVSWLPLARKSGTHPDRYRHPSSVAVRGQLVEAGGSATSDEVAEPGRHVVREVVEHPTIIGRGSSRPGVNQPRA